MTERKTSWLTTLALGALVVLAALSIGLGRTTAQSPTYDLRLTGDQEVPPVLTLSSGDFVATIDKDSVDYTLTVEGEGLTMAHFHRGAAGVNGPVVAFLYGPTPAGVSAINQSGSITAASLVGPLAGDWNGFVTALNNGEIYVNVHNLGYPSGALRVQMPAGRVPAAAFATTTATTTATTSATVAAASPTPKAPATGQGITEGGSNMGSWLIVITVVGVTGAAGAGYIVKRQ
ncbi:MAG: CHRD domain-containing protein [Tepidiformaceae bacterium]